jgi:hypothetical protein
MSWCLVLLLAILLVISILHNGQLPLRGVLLLIAIVSMTFFAPPVTFFMQVERREITPSLVKFGVFMFGGLMVSIITVLYLLMGPFMIRLLEETAGFPFISTIVCVGMFLIFLLLLKDFFSVERELGLESPSLLWLAVVSFAISIGIVSSFIWSDDLRFYSAYALPMLWLPFLAKLGRFQDEALIKANLTRSKVTTQPGHPVVVFCKNTI